jgi:hypothetical protein
MQVQGNKHRKGGKHRGRKGQAERCQWKGQGYKNESGSLHNLAQGRKGPEMYFCQRKFHNVIVSVPCV